MKRLPLFIIMALYAAALAQGPAGQHHAPPVPAHADTATHSKAAPAEPVPGDATDVKDAKDTAHVAETGAAEANTANRAEAAPAHQPAYTTAEFRSELIAAVFEDTGTILAPRSVAALDSVSPIVRRNRNHRYEVHGHICAGTGSLRVSVMRVESMINYLLTHGVQTANITTVINPPAGAARNCTRDRRVEVMLIETRQVELKPGDKPGPEEAPASAAAHEPTPEPEPDEISAPAPEPEEPKPAEIAAKQGKLAVAVYMAGDEPAGAQGVHYIMGGEMARVISRSDRYLAVDRTEAILNQLAKEHAYQRSGAVDDDQIRALGQQLGVSYLSISGINPVGKRYYLDTRLVNIETAEIIRSITETSALKDANEMTRVARHIALELIEPEAARIARLRRERIARYTSISLDVLGAGLFAYGYIENNNVIGRIDNDDGPEAARAATRRNIAYIAGGVILASGITIHILF